MKREFVLAVIVICGALATAVGAKQQGRGAADAPTSAAAIQADKVRDNLYLLRGGGLAGALAAGGCPGDLGRGEVANQGRSVAGLSVSSTPSAVWTESASTAARISRRSTTF